MTVAQVTELWRSVVAYFEERGMTVEGGALERISVKLVDAEEMARQAGHGLCGHGSGVGHIEGLTISTTTFTVIRTVEYRNGQKVYVDDELRPAGAGAAPLKRLHRRSVDRILLLYGLPLVAAGDVLAHEFVHAYHTLYEKRADPLDTSKSMAQCVSEGTAQLGSYHWLRDCVKNPRFASLKRLRLKSMETHSNPDYGEGFLKAREAFERITARRWLVFSGESFSKLFQVVAETGQLP